jgi:hypothetical protein
MSYKKQVESKKFFLHFLAPGFGFTTLILMRLWVKNFDVVAKFLKRTKVETICSFDYVRLLKILSEWVINSGSLCHFSIPNHARLILLCQSHSALRFRLQKNDTAPCGSGSAPLFSCLLKTCTGTGTQR